MEIVGWLLVVIIAVQVIDFATAGLRYERRLRKMNPGYTGQESLSSVLRRLSIDS